MFIKSDIPARKSLAIKLVFMLYCDNIILFSIFKNTLKKVFQISNLHANFIENMYVRCYIYVH